MFLRNLEEVTPLMLQKLLYFIQGVFCAVNERPMFYENCQAWMHGAEYIQKYMKCSETSNIILLKMHDLQY